jgi:hypothetical protein
MTARPEDFEWHCSLSFSIAYRMLGSVEDVMQEAYLRWQDAPEAEVSSPRSLPLSRGHSPLDRPAAFGARSMSPEVLRPAAHVWDPQRATGIAVAIGRRAGGHDGLGAVRKK